MHYNTTAETGQTLATYRQSAMKQEEVVPVKFTNECKAKTHGLTHERLRQVLSYCEETGVFTWLVTLNARGVKGTQAGSLHPDGYRRINIDSKSYPAHWLAYFFVLGEWPAEHLDHINGIRSDNRISNLRPCTRSENQQNKKLPKNKHAPGVTKIGNRFIAKIRIPDGGRICLGRYDTLEAAAAAYLGAKKMYHPFDKRNDL